MPNCHIFRLVFRSGLRKQLSQRTQALNSPRTTCSWIYSQIDEQFPYLFWSAPLLYVGASCHRRQDTALLGALRSGFWRLVLCFWSVSAERSGEVRSLILQQNFCSMETIADIQHLSCNITQRKSKHRGRWGGYILLHGCYIIALASAAGYWDRNMLFDGNKHFKLYLSAAMHFIAS